jgi:hypothetical protein
LREKEGEKGEKQDKFVSGAMIPVVPATPEAHLSYSVIAKLDAYGALIFSKI